MSSCQGKDGGALSLEKGVPLPCAKERIDQFPADTNGQRLFIGALGNGSTENIDTRFGERTH